MDVIGILWVFVTLMLIVIVLSFYRVIVGPMPHDRLVGLNLLVSEITALMTMLAVISGRHIYLDVALTYVILGFIGILAIAKYLKGKELHE